MFKLSKKVEYGLLAMQYLSNSELERASAKEIAQSLEISYEFLSKALQALLKSEIISSKQGAKGGYYLSKDAKDISLMDVIKSLDENTSLVDCMCRTGKSCQRENDCTLKGPIVRLQKMIDEIFENTTVADLRKKEFLQNSNNKSHLLQITEFKN